jgi:hypothetical protein
MSPAVVRAERRWFKLIFEGSLLVGAWPLQMWNGDLGTRLRMRMALHH